ncbi:MAG: hypothetical protein KDC35_20955 [Acidobacteria bacterium]|nr:hypothetical protein [Acidobacteriota bacterium]
MFFICLLVFQDSAAKQKVVQMIEACGGRDSFYAMRDVSFTYTYLNTATGARDVSEERYIFDGERSYAEFSHTENVLPDLNGKLVQGFDGQQAWATVNGQLVDDPKMMGMTMFLRKTNYYWFTMMFKLADPGLIYTDKGVRQVEGIAYDMVEIGFEQGVGNVQDTYLLYINPYTHLVDQFLFTVRDFGVETPLLMKVNYVSIDGLMIPTVRRFVQSDWDGTIQGDSWNLEITENVKFNQGLNPSMFMAPDTH